MIVVMSYVIKSSQWLILFALLHIIVLPVACSSLVTSAAAEAAPWQPARQFRRPVAAVTFGGYLYVANARSGSISVIDLGAGRAVAETPVARRLASMADTTAPGWALATDPQAHQLLLIRCSPNGATVAQRQQVSSYPTTIAVAQTGHVAAVAGKWSQRVDFVSISNLKGGASLSLDRTSDLPFIPGQLRFCDGDRRLIVSEAYGNRFAVLDVGTGDVLYVRSIQGHNIAGLATSPDGSSLLMTHQKLSDRLPTTRDHVFWGNLISNQIRSITFAEIDKAGRGHGRDLSPQPIHQWSIFPLGETNNAAGDPGAIRVTRDGAIIAALAGVDEVAVRRAGQSEFARIKVGSRPSSLALSDDARTLFVTNRFGDSVTQIDLAQQYVTRTVSLGPTPRLTDADRGEMAFHDAKLSLHGWYSCHSCHPDGHSISQLNDNFSDATFGTPKRVISLLGTADTSPWGWVGGSNTLEAQVAASMELTMQGKETGRVTKDNIDAIAAYMRTLPSAPGLSRARGTFDQKAFDRGKAVYFKLRCDQCHQPDAAYTSDKLADVGLTDELGVTRFNPPSLRGVSQRAAFFHDGRTQSLRDVLDKYQHGDADTLSAAERRDLIAFLLGL